MEDSPISLDKWMTAFWAVANCKNGISSHELGRTIGVGQEAAWFMLQRIREAMKDGGRCPRLAARRVARSKWTKPSLAPTLERCTGRVAEVEGG